MPSLKKREIEVFFASVLESFYDTSSDQLYRHITLSYIDNVQGYIIAYDVHNMESFVNCQYWLHEITTRHKCSQTGRATVLSWAFHLYKLFGLFDQYG
jgi:GTPase SAR1 family protein